MSRRRNRHRGGADRSTRPGFIRRRDRQGRNQAFVFDLTADGFVPVDSSGKVNPEAPLGPTEIPVDVAEDVYDDEDIEDAE